MKRYNPSEIEPKWQKIWVEKDAFRAVDFDARPKTYVSPMFPYPSGAGMHTGHAFEHSIVDAVARFNRQHGHNVLNPMGWDAFGLPTENYAIKTGISPIEATEKFIASFKNQINRLGSSIDWSREINTSDPEYYKWTQWIFTKLYERGLAYQKEALQWWCPVDKTVLANEQVIDGKCWRCGSEVEKKSMKQWFFKITDYADELLEELPDLDWPNKIKVAQENWIGRSEGAEVNFDDITVFTTRPDTIFGATFVVLAPEHPLGRSLAIGEFKQNVENYIDTAIKKSEIERTNESKEKTGVFTGSYVKNPVTGQPVPVWIADYVLGGYGTGAIMAVPAHDERDYTFAEKFGLPIVKVIEDDKLINSGDFDGHNVNEAREQIVAWLEEQKLGKSKTTYKMRDWLISRQRYWGAPIPIIHCDEHGAVAVPEKDLPVILPVLEDFAPKGDGLSTLARATDWVNTTCPECGKPARRETDTMDGYACSSWYLLRYNDPHNTEKAFDPAKVNYWSPLDFYVGGDHAVAHLLYVRFWTHVFHDMGLTDFKEPVKKLVYHGYINAPDGRKMSKSLGNVIDPIEIIDQGYGADTLRTYLLFMGPIELDASWDPSAIGGVYRFLNRVWTLSQEFIGAPDDTPADRDFSPLGKHGENLGSSTGKEGAINSITRLQHKTIKKVTNDYRRLSFNTVISALMEYVNELYLAKTNGFDDPAWQEALETLVQLVAPIAPHLAEELWSQLGHGNLIQEAMWPDWDEVLLVEDTITLAVQVNGKVRGEITISADADEETIKAEALKQENVAKFVTSEPKKVIYVKNRLVSIVI